VTPGGDPAQLVTFLLAGEEYAVGIDHVLEIVACGPITRVPSLPPFIRGAMNLRGRAVPIVDLAHRLGLGEATVGRYTCVVMVRVDVAGEPTTLGALVDEVRRLVDAAPGDVGPPPPIGTRVHPEYLVGFCARAGEALLPVLDLARVLSTEELLLVADAERAPALPGGGP
jgi:purine-binding chemotaxis protein CheW